MKRKGSVSDFSSDRKAELKAAFLSQGIYSVSDEVLTKALKTPSSRFWVDPYRARDIMSKIEKNPASISGMHPERRRMYMALFEKYKEIRRQCPSATKINAVSTAIYSGAPEFFLSPSSARRLLYR